MRSEVHQGQSAELRKEDSSLLPFWRSGCFLTIMKNSSLLSRRKFISAAALASAGTIGRFDSSLIAAENSRLIVLDSPDHLILKGCKATMAEHRGRRAVQLSGLPETPQGLVVRSR